MDNNRRLRLNRYLARCGIGSRRRCEELILASKIKVNNEVITNLATYVDVERDIVQYQDKKLNLTRENHSYLLYKPRNYLTTLSDPHGRPTVKELIQHLNNEALFPVGRLDGDVDGVLLITDDGLLGHRLAHPKYEIDKVYHCLCSGNTTSTELRQLEMGIHLEEGITSPAKVNFYRHFQRNTLVELCIHQGWKNQVKRMFDAIDHPIIRLRRVAFGTLDLKHLKKGQTRELSKNEVTALHKLVGLPS